MNIKSNGGFYEYVVFADILRDNWKMFDISGNSCSKIKSAATDNQNILCNIKNPNSYMIRLDRMKLKFRDL